MIHQPKDGHKRESYKPGYARLEKESETQSHSRIHIVTNNAHKRGNGY